MENLKKKKNKIEKSAETSSYPTEVGHPLEEEGVSAGEEGGRVRASRVCKRTRRAREFAMIAKIYRCGVVVSFATLTRILSRRPSQGRGRPIRVPGLVSSLVISTNRNIVSNRALSPLNCPSLIIARSLVMFVARFCDYVIVKYL